MDFNPRSPYGERLPVYVVSKRKTYFNPRSPYGERLPFEFDSTCLQVFQSTLPLRGATLSLDSDACGVMISIHAPLTGSDAWYIKHASHVLISIHAPLTGSDRRLRPTGCRIPNFNPRSPYGERQNSFGCQSLRFLFQSTLPLRGATAFRGIRPTKCGFQSTLPLRGATVFLPPFFPPFDYFNPRSPYGERPWCLLLSKGGIMISIHAPLTGSDYNKNSGDHVPQFQSTLPLRGATNTAKDRMPKIAISIHAPLTGSDIIQSIKKND